VESTVRLTQSQYLGQQARHLLHRGLFLFLFILFQIPFLFQPIQGHHRFRQADTAAVARNLAFETFDPLRPRIDRREDKSGIVSGEFPLYQMIVATGFSVAGDYDVVGKLVSLLAAITAWVVLTELLVRRAAIDFWAAQAALGSCPFFFIYGSRFMPETFALLLAVVALKYFEAHRRLGGQTALWMGTTTLSLAALVRPYAVFVGLPLACFWIGELRQRRPGWKYLAAGVAAAVPFLLWYYVWWPHLVRVYDLDYFFGGEFFLISLSEMLHPAFWASVANTITKFYLNWLCIPFAIWGAMRLWRVKPRIPGVGLIAFWLPVVAVPSLCLLIGTQFVAHEYYFLSLVPWSVLLVAAGLSGLRNWHPRLGIATCVLVAVLTPGLFWKHYRSNTLLAAYHPVAAEIATRTRKDELVLIEEVDPDDGAWYLHPIRRRGWIEPRSRLYERAHVVELRQRGLRWVVWYDDYVYHLSDVDTWLARLEAGK